MKVSVIIPLYKDLLSLDLILESLRRQTYRDFEVIIAEDDDSQETISFLGKQQGLAIKHISQPDTGRNKVIIQNKAIACSAGDYLVFIDGDIIPFKHFIEYSLKIAKPERILTGRRVNLNRETATLIRSGEINVIELERKKILFFLRNFKDRNVRAEQVIEISPSSILYKLLSKRKRNTDVLGCNFSCYKEAMIKINGFDEDYHPSATLADDTDLTWRFSGMGFELYSSKNVANCFHLWHETGGERESFDASKGIDLFVSNQRAKQYRCVNGVDKYL